MCMVQRMCGVRGMLSACGVYGAWGSCFAVYLRTSSESHF